MCLIDEPHRFRFPALYEFAPLYLLGVIPPERQEVALLADPFHLELADINNILLNGVRHSFLPTQEKQALEQQFLQEMKPYND